MIRLVGRVWVPMVMVLVVAVGAFTVSRLHRVFGSDPYHPDAGNADAIVQFNPKRVLYEIFGPAGAVADINYLDADAQPQRVDAARLPWSLLLVTTLTAVSANQPKMIGTDSRRIIRAITGRASASVGKLCRVLMPTSPSKRSAHCVHPPTADRAHRH